MSISQLSGCGPNTSAANDRALPAAHTSAKTEKKIKGDSSESAPVSPDDNFVRIFACPVCEQRIRINLPVENRNGKCSKCASKFLVWSDEAGNLYISKSVTGIKNEAKGFEIRTIEDCFLILELPSNAPARDIRAAYRKKMHEYHPDKVATLGGKLKEIANVETQKLNIAFAKLQENGNV